MSDLQTPATPTRDGARRDLNKTIAQRQKLLLAGMGGLALIGGAWFIFGGEDETAGADGGAVIIDTAGIVDRNLSQREFVASYGNRLDAQGRAIKEIKDAQLPRPAIEQELEALRSENAQMRSDGQAAIDAISAENAALRGELQQAASAPVAAAAPLPTYGPGAGGQGNISATSGSSAAAPAANGGAITVLSFGEASAKDGKRPADGAPSPLLLEASRDYLRR
jgi:conjugal transfer pilus assembly protein TraB